jgi:hypothetical protein
MEVHDRKMTAGEARLGLCQMACVSTGGADSFRVMLLETLFTAPTDRKRF